MSTQRLGIAVALAGAAGVLVGVAAAAGAVEPGALVTVAAGVGLVYVATGLAAVALERTDRRMLAAPVALAIVVGVLVDAAQLLLVTAIDVVDVLLGRTVVGVGAPTGWSGGGVTFGSLAILLALAFPLGLSWRRRHRWLLSGLAVAAALPLAATVAAGLANPETADGVSVLNGAFVGGIVLLAAQPPFELGRRLRRPGWSGVATLPLFLATMLGCALQVVAVATGFALRPADALGSGTLTLVLVALGPILLLAARGYHAASQQRTPPSARGG